MNNFSFTPQTRPLWIVFDPSGSFRWEMVLFLLLRKLRYLSPTHKLSRMLPLRSLFVAVGAFLGFVLRMGWSF